LLKCTAGFTQTLAGQRFSVKGFYCLLLLMQQHGYRVKNTLHNGSCWAA
jgi:hypothetical protein